MSTKQQLAPAKKGGKQLEQEDKKELLIETTKISHAEYLHKNDKVKELLTDFAATLLLQKPESVWDFVKEFFEPYNKGGAPAPDPSN
jgi:hypothetical protein